MSIIPTLEISGRTEGGAVIVARVEFDNFDKAMEFNALLIDFLKREMAPAEPEVFIDGALGRPWQPATGGDDMSLLEECLQSQTAAGFSRPDERRVSCPNCNAAGYNSGWGYWKFECGAETITDGTPDIPCPRPTAAAEGG